MSRALALGRLRGIGGYRPQSGWGSWPRSTPRSGCGSASCSGSPWTEAWSTASRAARW